MGRVPLSEFVGSRVRFQRLSDQEVFAGWLKELSSHHLVLDTEQDVEIGAGERFLFQAQGTSADAYFIAGRSPEPVSGANRYMGFVQGNAAHKLVDLPAISYTFDVLTQIQIRDAQQLPRKAVDALVAKLSAKGKTSEVLVADASSGGMGVIAWEELRRGDVIEIDISCPEVKAKFTCEVRHCRPEARLIGAYRLGLQFQNADRVSLMCWRRLVNQA